MTKFIHDPRTRRNVVLLDEDGVKITIETTLVTVQWADELNPTVMGLASILRADGAGGEWRITSGGSKLEVSGPIPGGTQLNLPGGEYEIVVDKPVGGHDPVDG